jgi:hypothetical protein
LEAARARELFDLPLRWSVRQQNPFTPDVSELNAIRDEASQLLGIEKRKH